jgi:hypothetical protein
MQLLKDPVASARLLENTQVTLRFVQAVAVKVIYWLPLPVSAIPRRQLVNRDPQRVAVLVVWTA